MPQGFENELPALTSWLQSNQFLHGKGASHFFNGIGGHGTGHLANLAMSPCEWIKNHNFAGLSPRSISALSPMYQALDGVNLKDVSRMISQLKQLETISLKKHGVVGFFLVTASDAMAIKPGLQVAQQANGIVGLLDPPLLSLEQVKELQKMTYPDLREHLKTLQFNTQALEVHLTSLDDKVSRPVAVFYGVSQGGWQVVQSLYERLQVINMCEACLGRSTDCSYKCDVCWTNKQLCETCRNLGHREWHPMARPCLACLTKNITCYRVLQLGWSSDCESRQKAFMERLFSRYPNTLQFPMPDPPHNIKSVRSSLFWYWLFLDEYLINIRIILAIRRDSNSDISTAVQKSVSLKALKNKDRMSVETALEIFSPQVQCSLPKEDVLVTIIPEIYTFWRQNRPGVLQCPVGVAVHYPTGTFFTTDYNLNQIMCCDLHCPVSVTSIAGEKQPGYRDGKKSLFHEPSGICLFNNLLFICDTGNSLIRVTDVARLLSRKKNAATLHVDESDDTEDNIPIASKYTVTQTLNLVSTSKTPLSRPFAICTGRKLSGDFPDLYVGDTRQKMIFKITDVEVQPNKCRARLTTFYPPRSSSIVGSTNIVPFALIFSNERVFVGNGQSNDYSIVILHAQRGTVLHKIDSPLIVSPSGICLLGTKEGNHLFVSCGNHTIVKISQCETSPVVKLYSGKTDDPGSTDGVISTAKFHSPHGIANMGQSLFICDSGNSAIRLISNAQPLQRLSSVLYPYAQVFDVDHHRGTPRYSFEESMSIIDNLVHFFTTWGQSTQERTGRISTQGPDQVLPYVTRRSFHMMHESLNRLHNLFSELGLEDIIKEVRFPSMVTLMVENFFSLMRKNDPMPTQLEYGIRRASCVRELEKRMYDGYFHYFTSPKSHYPEKVINSAPPTVKNDILDVEEGIQRLTIEETKELREFASAFGKSVRQHTVRDKSKEETGHLPYEISYTLQSHQEGVDVLTTELSEGHSKQTAQGTFQRYRPHFKVNDILAIRHNRKREKWGFFLAILQKDLLVKDGASELDFSDVVMDVLWLDNNEDEDQFRFKEAYRDCRNSPYSIIDKVENIEISVNNSDGSRAYRISEDEVLRIERLLKGGIDSDVESEDEAEDASDKQESNLLSVTTRSGRSATRIKLN